MKSSTFPRMLAVLTFGLVFGSMTFLAGARAGAVLNGRVNGVTLAHSPMPRLEAAAVKRAQVQPQELANR
jgi:hypothetical protein